MVGVDQSVMCLKHPSGIHSAGLQALLLGRKPVPRRTGIQHYSEIERTTSCSLPVGGSPSFC